jgi:hypothetical protein
LEQKAPAFRLIWIPFNSEQVLHTPAAAAAAAAAAAGNISSQKDRSPGTKSTEATGTTGATGAVQPFGKRHNPFYKLSFFVIMAKNIRFYSR